MSGEQGARREMRLISKLIALDPKTPDRSLAEFIARRRHPNAGPKSWDEIRFELREVIGEIITDGTLRRWGAFYGIPDGGRNITLTAKEYERGLKAAGIDLSTP